MRTRPLLKTLLRDPRTAVPALLLLALGVGGFAWMMALQRSMMLRSLPAPRPDRLVSLWSGMADEPDSRGTPSTGDLQQMRRFPEVFQGVAAWDATNANLGLDVPHPVRLDRVTANYFEVLGVRPALGRGFMDADDAEGAPATVLLSHTAWKNRFGGDPGLVGRSLQVNGESVQVIGVLPEGFHTPHGTELFAPFRWTLAQRDNHGPHFLSVMARLRDGATLPQAQAAMDQLAVRMRELWKGEAPPSLLVKLRYGASPLLDEVLGHGLVVLRVLRIATGLVLLLAAYNAAALLLARGLGRRGEMAVRSALGAAPAELRRILLTEGALLGLLGALGGLALATLAMGPTGQALSWSFPDLAMDGLAMDLPSVLLALLLGPALGAGCALMADPGRRLSEILRCGGRNRTLAVGRSRRLLVGAQLVLGGALLSGALSLQHGLGRMMDLDPGFSLDRTWCFQIQPGRQMPLELRNRLAQAVLERLRALPGVEAAGAANGLPMSGFFSDLYTTLPDGRRIDPQARALTPGVVRALGMRLLRGRDLAESDAAEATPVMLVTRRLAIEAFGTEDAVGRILRIQDTDFQVVGVLADVRDKGPAQAAPPVFYVPLAQSSIVWNENLYFTFRCTGPAPSEAQLRQVLRETAPGRAMHRYRAMRVDLEERLGAQRMARAFMGVFAGLALLLAAGGVFGLMASSVALRRAEFGVRSSLGATPASLLGLVLQEALKLAGLSGLVGVLAGRALEHFGSPVLGAWPAPPLLLGLIALASLVGASLIAALLPSLRAATVPPSEALREP